MLTREPKSSLVKELKLLTKMTVEEIRQTDWFIGGEENLICRMPFNAKIGDIAYIGDKYSQKVIRECKIMAITSVANNSEEVISYPLDTNYWIKRMKYTKKYDYVTDIKLDDNTVKMFVFNSLRGIPELTPQDFIKEKAV